MAPLRIETGRYENIAENERFCTFCIYKVEDEMHGVLECAMYDENSYLIKHYQHFIDVNETEKILFLFSNKDIFLSKNKNLYIFDYVLVFFLFI